jgi:hypothetical protein
LRGVPERIRSEIIASVPRAPDYRGVAAGSVDYCAVSEDLGMSLSVAPIGSNVGP